LGIALNRHASRPDYSPGYPPLHAGRRTTHLLTTSSTILALLPRRCACVEERGIESHSSAGCLSFIWNCRKIPLQHPWPAAPFALWKGTPSGTDQTASTAASEETLMNCKITRRSAVALAAAAPVALATRAFAQSPIVIKFSHVVANDTPKGKGSL